MTAIPNDVTPSYARARLNAPPYAPSMSSMRLTV